MPTYEYRCPEGHEFEKFYSRIADSQPELECPECGKLAERRISGGAALLFKGSGFYLTDYGRNAHRKSPPEKKESGSKESKSESKSGDKGSSGSGESGGSGSSGGMKAGESGSAGGDKSSGAAGGKSPGGSGSTGSKAE